MSDYPKNIGCAIANRITAAFVAANTGLSYEQIVDIVYPEVADIGREQSIGDWISAPDGTTWTLTWKPTPKA